MRTIHELKTWSKYWKAIQENKKLFEVRKDDRMFRVGDILHLMEYYDDIKEYTGRELHVRVTYILEGGNFGIEKGFVLIYEIEHFNKKCKHKEWAMLRTGWKKCYDCKEEFLTD